MRETFIDLNINTRAELCDSMASLLATSIVLKLQSKQAHWVIRGREFKSLHGLFDEVAASMDIQADTIAERIATLGGYPKGMASNIVKKSLIEDSLPETSDSQIVLNFITRNFGIYAGELRKAISYSERLQDAVSADMFTSLCRETEKTLWFLEASLD